MPEPTATNPQTGEKLVFRGGQWVPAGAGSVAPPAAPVQSAPSPQFPGVIEGRPRVPAQPDVPSGWAVGPDGVARPVPGLPASAVTGLEPENAQPSATELDLANKEESARKRANTVTALMSEVQRLYEQDIKGQPLSRGFGLTEYIDAIPANERFTAAGNNILPLIRPLVAQTAKEGDSDREMAVFQSYVPSADDSDITIEQKMKMLEMLIGGMVDGKAPSEILAGTDRRDDGAPAAAPQGGPPPVAPDQPGPAVPPRIPGAPTDNGGDGSLGLSQNGYTTRDNPMLSGVRDEYLSRLGRGDSAESIIKWAREVGIHPSAFRSIGEQVRYRRNNPQVPLSQYDTSELDDEVIPLSASEQAINAAAQSPLGAGLIAAGDAASGFTLDEIIGATGGDADRARLGMAQVAEQNPVSSTIGTLAGGTLMALGGEAALGARGMAAGLPRALLADSAYGAAAGAGGADDGNRLAGAGMGALAGAAGSYLGSRVGNALGSVARGVTDPSVNALRSEGVNALTMGQTFGNSGRVGQAIKSVEDRLSGIPVLGDVVNARRGEGMRQFNARAFDKALEPIGATIGDAVGEEAVERAQDAVSQAFTKALAGKGAVPDQAFARDLTASVMGVRSIKRIGEELDGEVADILEPYFNGTMLSGEALDDISRNLRDLKGRYRNDPLGQKAARQIDRVERAIFDLFDRQASGTIPEYMAARQAYRRLSILEDAVLKARNQKDRVFTPAQLGQADRANAKKFGGKRAAARGDTPFFDYQQAGQDVLPNRVPDSGTVGRALVPLALVGAGGGVDAASGGTGGAGLTIGGILAALYSRTGQRLLTKPGRGMKPGTRRRAVLESDRTRRTIGAAGAASGAAALTNQQ